VLANGAPSAKFSPLVETSSYATVDGMIIICELSRMTDGF